MTKNIILLFLFVVSFLLCTISYGQKTIPYTIDATIRGTVDKNIKSVDFPVLSSMNFTQTFYDSTDLDNYNQKKSFGAITKAAISHDTIFIASILMAREASLGYEITITNDSCSVRYFTLADENIYKANKTDKPNYLIHVDCALAKLTLAQKPTFKAGKSIEGMKALTTDDFWSVTGGHDTKVKVQLNGYFKTTLTQFQPNEKDIFSQIQ